MTTDLTPDLQIMRNELIGAARRDLQSRTRRRGSVRACAIGATGALVLSGSALAAGDVLGLVELGGGLRAQQVNTYPAYNVSTHRFVQVHGEYLYHVTGGRVRGLSACPTHENDIYIESSRALTEPQLQLAAELANGGNQAPMVKRLGGYETASKEVPGLKSLSDGCGNAGVEATIGGPAGSASTGAAAARARRKAKQTVPAQR
jgi:hypothetical protein